MRNDPSQLAGATDRANTSRKADTAKRAAGITIGWHVEMPKTGIIARLLLFVLTAGMLSRVNTEKNKELHAAIECSMQGQAGVVVVADVNSGEILASRKLELGRATGGKRPWSTEMGLEP